MTDINAFFKPVAVRLVKTDDDTDDWNLIVRIGSARKIEPGSHAAGSADYVYAVRGCEVAIEGTLAGRTCRWIGQYASADQAQHNFNKWVADSGLEV